jgi:multisubunit Na+/H+ antiporter MnhG subunit
VATSASTGTYLLLVGIGFVLTIVVGQILMRSGVGFLRDVFDDNDIAASITRLLGVGFHLIALGFLALVSTWDPFEIQGTVQYVVTKTGAIMLFLGIAHVITLAALARVRNNRRVQTMAASLRGGGRRPQRGQGDRTQALEG